MLSTFIRLQYVIKIFVLSIFEWSFYTGLTVVKTFLPESISAYSMIVLTNPNCFLKFASVTLVDASKMMTKSVRLRPQAKI